MRRTHIKYKRCYVELYSVVLTLTFSPSLFSYFNFCYGVPVKVVLFIAVWSRPAQPVTSRRHFATTVSCCLQILLWWDGLYPLPWPSRDITPKQFWRLVRSYLRIHTLYSWFKTFAVFWTFYASFWVIPRRLNSDVGKLPGRKHKTYIALLIIVLKMATPWPRLGVAFYN